MTSKSPLPKLAYSVPELAAISTVSEAKLWREIAEGELETALVGDRRIITPEMADRWLARKSEIARRKRETAA